MSPSVVVFETPRPGRFELIVSCSNLALTRACFEFGFFEPGQECDDSSIYYLFSLFFFFFLFLNLCYPVWCCGGYVSYNGDRRWLLSVDSIKRLGICASPARNQIAACRRRRHTRCERFGCLWEILWLGIITLHDNPFRGGRDDFQKEPTKVDSIPTRTCFWRLIKSSVSVKECPHTKLVKTIELL